VTPSPTTEPAKTDENDSGNASSTGDASGNASSTGGASAVQIEFTKYAEFTSNFGFSISYPAAWYYKGSSSNYQFADKDLEDGGSPILTLTWSSSGQTGLVRTESTVTVTSSVDGKFYSLTGPLAYENTVIKMAESIKSKEA
jgi:hypothetical protein